MAKAVTQFVCQECGHVQARWAGRCPSCSAWNSFIEETITATSGSGAPTSGSQLETVSLNTIKLNIASRLATKISEIDQVLGGGVVPGSSILLAGEPGVGKSTLLLQLAQAVASHVPVLYVSAEESLVQLKLRAQRLKVPGRNLELAATTSADDIAATAQKAKFKLIIVDSIQTVASSQLSSAAGSISQIVGSTQLLRVAAKSSNTAMLLVGHVTKEGNIAGPKLLEHLVDVVLQLEGERFGSFKLLRGLKNRFGSTDEVGIFEMREDGLHPVVNPSAAFLHERAGGDGSVVLATLEGSRALLVEVQALVSPSPFGYPKRTASGFDLNRLNLLLAVLAKRARVNLGAQDVYVNIVGGLKVMEPAADLAVALALASAAQSKAVTEGMVAFGEIGLNGELRSVAQVDKRSREAKKLGFKLAIAPSAATGPAFIRPVRSLAEALSLAFK